MIISRHNEQLKRIRRARRCKDGEAVLEGPHLLSAALDAGVRIATVLATPAFLADENGRALAARLPRAPLEAAPERLAEVADSDAPRGVIAIAELPWTGVEALAPGPGHDRDRVYLYLDGVQDPGNLGAIARVAEAGGAAGLALAPSCAHPEHPRAMRASAGSLLRLPLARRARVDDLDAVLAPARPQWIALAASGGEPLYDLKDSALGGTLVLALGAEGPGLSPTVAARAARAVCIPLAPPVESLNVAVAAGVVLFELLRRRR